MNLTIMDGLEGGVDEMKYYEVCVCAISMLE